MKSSIFLFCLLLPCLVIAKGYSPAVTARPGGYDVKFSSSGQPIAVPVSGGASALVQAPFTFLWPNGVDAAGAAVSIFTGAKTAGAWGAASAVLGIGALYAIPAIKSWMDTAGVVPMNGGGVGKPASGDAYDYSTDSMNWSSTAMGACYRWADAYNAQFKSSGTWGKMFPKRHLIRSPQSGKCFGDYILQNYNSTQYDSYDIDLVDTAARDKIIPVESTPITIVEAQELLALPTPTQSVVQALVDANFPPPAELPTLTGTASQFKGNIVSLGLDGTVTDIEERYVASFKPGGIDIGVEKKQTVTTPVKTSTSITTNPDGTNTTAVITTPASTKTITTTSPSSSAEVATVTCGLPTSPPCAISEAGVPGQPEVDAVMKTSPAQIQKDIDDITKNPKAFFPPFPTLNWAFALPTGCAQIPTPAFAPALSQIDVCTFQPMFHDLMSVVWMLGGLFGAISLFMKNALSS